jgi:predicted permease
MSDIFISSFSTMFYAVAKILMIALIAGILVRRKVISQEHVRGLSEITVMVLLPAMMFSNTVNTFKPSETVGWWIIPILGMVFPFIGLLFCHLLFYKRPREGRNIFAVSSFPNAAYLILPIGQIVFKERFDEFALYCFLFVMGINPVLWSIGKFYSTVTDREYSANWKEFITPPLVANLTAVILVLLNVHVYIPNLVKEPIEMIASATVPMATFVLGATLGGISLRIWPKVSDLLKMLLIKFILIPGFVVFFIYILDIHKYSSLLAAFLVIEASAAPATNIIVMIRKYGGDTQQVGGLMLVSYFIAIIAMPLWIAFWDTIH